MSDDLTAKSALECAQAITAGSTTSTEVTTSFADNIAATDNSIKAWQHYNKDLAIQKAEQIDRAAATDHSTQPRLLHGIPVGLKDIIDTKDQPTEYGSPIHFGRQPSVNSVIVDKLITANAVIMGKTVTTEFAFFSPSATHNPHNNAHSPGGSSSGSAAAVAAGHVPLAIGSQTTGSVVRPAAFCGVYGYKPSRGLVSRTGVLRTSETLDHIGVFANHLEDIAAITDVIAGYDKKDPASYNDPAPGLLETYQQTTASTPSIVWIDMPYRERYSADAEVAFERLIQQLGGCIHRISAPTEFSEYLDAQKTIYFYEIVNNLKSEVDNHWEQISQTAQPIFLQALKVTKDQYAKALKTRQSAMAWFDEFFTKFDAILTPSAVSEAPLMGSTGDPICCALWTLCGLPCINIPYLTGEKGLPLGVQLVGAIRQDHQHLQNTRILQEMLSKN